MRPSRLMMACAVAGAVAGCSAPQGPAPQGPATHGSVTHSTAPGGSTAASLRPAAATRAASPRTAVPVCSRSQLVAGGLGVSAAAGTAIVTIRVTNVSSRGCSLEGRPAVTFLGAAGQALPVAVSALTGVGRAVVPLVPHTGPPAPYATLGDRTTAGFVVTTADDMQPGEPCQAVTALRIALPSVPGSFVIGGFSNPDFRFSVCEFSAGVSPVAAAALIDGYAPAFPACLASWFGASVAVQATSAAGTRLVVTVTSHTTAPCTIDGYPDASLTSGSSPVVLGYRAGRANALLPAPAIPRPVTLLDGASASAVLATAAPDPHSPQCRAWSTLSVVLPGDSAALRINRTVDVCGAVPGAGAFVAGS